MTTALNLANHANYINTSGALNLTSSGITGNLPTTKGGTNLSYTPVVADLNKTFVIKNIGSTQTPNYQFQVSRFNLSDGGSFDSTGTPISANFVATADGNGTITWTNPNSGAVLAPGVVVPNVSFTSATSGVNRTFSSGVFGFYNSASAMEVLWNGVALVPTEDFTFTGPTGGNLGFITILASINVGDNIEVAPSFSGVIPIPSFKVNLTQGQLTVADDIFNLYNSVLDLEITINGITLVPGEDFQLLGRTVTLNYVATANDVFQVQPASYPGRETPPIWTSPLTIPVNGTVVASSATFVQPGGVFSGALTMLQGTQTSTVSGTWLNLGSLASTGNSALWTRLT